MAVTYFHSEGRAESDSLAVQGTDRALTDNKEEEEEAHSPSPMKNTQRKTTAHNHPGPK
jgi:hypothetical protein